MFWVWVIRDKGSQDPPERKPKSFPRRRPDRSNKKQAVFNRQMDGPLIQKTLPHCTQLHFFGKRTEVQACPAEWALGPRSEQGTLAVFRP